MDGLQLDAKAAVKEFLVQHGVEIEASSEQNAEEYVSSKLGLTDSDDSKEIIKQQYKEVFVEELKARL